MPARANRVEPPQVRSRGKLSRPKSTRAYIWTGLIWSVKVILNPRGGMTAPVPAPTPRYRGCPIHGPLPPPPAIANHRYPRGLVGLVGLVGGWVGYWGSTRKIRSWRARVA